MVAVALSGRPLNRLPMHGACG